MMALCQLIFIFCLTTAMSTNLPSYLNSDTFYYSYGGTPVTQFNRFPQCFNQKRQSPIDINEPIQVDPTAKLILSESWNTPRKKVILLNTGHKPQVVDALSEPRRFLTFKGEKYEFSNRHYHYGSTNNNNEGSEHTLFGQRYVLEAHTYFFNSKYKDKDEAEGKQSGILEMSELYQIGDMKLEFEPVLNNLKYITYPNQTVNVNVNDILSTIIPFKSKFYYFDGSSSGPKCDQGTTWIVFDEIQTISQDQMNRFRNVLRTEKGTFQVKSWRYLQARNGRVIYSSLGTKNNSFYGLNEIIHV